MPVWIDHLLVLLLAVFFPIRASTFGYRRLVAAPEDDVVRVRRALYLQALWLQWGFVLALLLLWVWRARSWAELGLVAQLTPVAHGVAVSAVLLAALLLFQGRRAVADDQALDKVMRRLEHVERMLPRTGEELRMFHALSVTAGVCEELLYRGFLMWYFGHWLAPLPSLALSAVLFGIGHSYQGWRGVLLTALVGVFLGLVYVAAGSLYPAMLLHAVGDIHSGTLAHAALNRRPKAETEAVGAEAASQP